MEKITNSAGRINNSQPIETTDKTSNSHTFDKALKAISKPILREGSIKQFDVEINETTIRAHKTITSAFRKMYSRVANEGVNKGHRFHSELNGRTLEEFKKQNIKEVRSLFSSPYDEPTKTEKAFITNFLEKNSILHTLAIAHFHLEKRFFQGKLSKGIVQSSKRAIPLPWTSKATTPRTLYFLQSNSAREILHPISKPIVYLVPKNLH